MLNEIVLNYSNQYWFLFGLILWSSLPFQRNVCLTRRRLSSVCIDSIRSRRSQRRNCRSVQLLLQANMTQIESSSKEFTTRINQKKVWSEKKKSGIQQEKKCKQIDKFDFSFRSVFQFFSPGPKQL